MLLHEQFRRYWSFLSPGIILIRWASLGPLSAKRSLDDDRMGITFMGLPSGRPCGGHEEEASHEHPRHVALVLGGAALVVARLDSGKAVEAAVGRIDERVPASTPEGSEPGWFHNLVVSRGSSGDVLQLSGHVTASVASSIRHVFSYLAACDPGGPLCFSGISPFTSRLLTDVQGNPAPIHVTAGQIIQVKVVISFS